MARVSEQVKQSTSQDSALMLSALGVLAYAASMMTHEALGHAVYCLAAGGRNTMLTAYAEGCSISGGYGIKAAGPGVQFGAGLLAWLALRRLSTNAGRLRFFFWLYMVFSLFISSGYVMFSGTTNIGDAAELIARLHPRIVWRSGLFVIGSVVYFLSMRVGAFEFKRFAGDDDGMGRLFRLVWIPYAAVGVFACCTGALNRTMEHGAALGFAAASSFGAGSGMFGLPPMAQVMVSRGRLPAVYVYRSTAWGVVAAVVLVGFLTFIGPGLR